MNILLAVITSYFNPYKCKYRFNNFQRFTDHLKDQRAELFIIELVMSGEEFELNPSLFPNLVQIKTQSLMFQKERLLNVLIEKLPSKFDSVCWIDSDILYLQSDWQERVVNQLQRHTVVQPFQYAVSLPSCQFDFLSPTCLRAYDCNGTSLIRKGLAFHVAETGNTDYCNGHMGYVWAARRDFLEKHKLYDAVVTGAGDLFMAMAFFKSPGWIDSAPSLRSLSDEAVNHYFDWYSEVSQDVGEVGFTQDLVIHLWHGDIDNRNYLDHSGILQRCNFDPNNDLCISNDGCWEWKSNKTELHDAIRQIFRAQHLI